MTSLVCSNGSSTVWSVSTDVLVLGIGNQTYKRSKAKPRGLTKIFLLLQENPEMILGVLYAAHTRMRQRCKDIPVEYRSESTYTNVSPMNKARTHTYTPHIASCSTKIIVVVVVDTRNQTNTNTLHHTHRQQKQTQSLFLSLLI